MGFKNKLGTDRFPTPNRVASFFVHKICAQGFENKISQKLEYDIPGFESIFRIRYAKQSFQLSTHHAEPRVKLDHTDLNQTPPSFISLLPWHAMKQ